MRRHLVLAPLLLLAAAAPAPAAAAEPVWATVNYCDSASSPNAVGVRANLPGRDARAGMYARFTAEWLDPRSNAWKQVDGVPSSPWVSAGSGRQLSAQVGWTFDFDPPPPGAGFQIRGVAELEWRQGGSAGRRETLVTSGGIGADIGETSLATCALR